MANSDARRSAPALLWHAQRPEDRIGGLTRRRPGPHASAATVGRRPCLRLMTCLRGPLHADAVEPDRLVKALHLRYAVVLEGKPLAEADLPDCARNQDAAGKAVCAQPGRQLDRSAEEITLLCHRLPAAHPNPEPKRVGGPVVALGDLALDFDGAPHRVRDRGEGGHDPIPGVFDLDPGMGRERRPDDGIVRPQKPHRTGVANPHRPRSGALDVGEQDRAEGGVREGFAQLRLEDRAHERSNRARVDQDDPGGGQPVGVTVHRLHGDRVRTLREAEGGPALRIEPVSDVPDAVLLLDLDVSGVGNGKVNGGHAGDIVAVQEERHSYLINALGTCPLRILQGWLPADKLSGRFQQVAADTQISLSEQLKKLPPSVRSIVQAARRAVKVAAPGATEITSRSQPPRSSSYMWKMVRYAVDGRNVVGIGAFRSHAALFFYRGRELGGGSGLLQGGGKEARFITLRAPADAQRPVVVRMVRKAFKLGG